jgi:hypothetical protein
MFRPTAIIVNTIMITTVPTAGKSVPISGMSSRYGSSCG